MGARTRGAVKNKNDGGGGGRGKEQDETERTSRRQRRSDALPEYPYAARRQQLRTRVSGGRAAAGCLLRRNASAQVPAEADATHGRCALVLAAASAHG